MFILNICYMLFDFRPSNFSIVLKGFQSYAARYRTCTHMYYVPTIRIYPILCSCFHFYFKLYSFFEGSLKYFILITLILCRFFRHRISDLEIVVDVGFFKRKC